MAFADEDIGDRGEGGEISRGADGAEFGDGGGDVGVQKVDDGLGDDGANTGVATSQRCGEEEHGAANDVGGERCTDSGVMGADEVGLQGGEVVIVDATFGEGAEAGIDAVVGLSIGEGGFDDFA